MNGIAILVEIRTVDIRHGLWLHTLVFQQRRCGMNRHQEGFGTNRNISIFGKPTTWTSAAVAFFGSTSLTVSTFAFFYGVSSSIVLRSVAVGIFCVGGLVFDQLRDADSKDPAHRLNRVRWLLVFAFCSAVYGALSGVANHDYTPALWGVLSFASATIQCWLVQNLKRHD